MAVNGYCMTVGMPPKPSQTFIMTKDSALKLSIGAKPSVHTALGPEALTHSGAGDVRFQDMSIWLTGYVYTPPVYTVYIQEVYIQGKIHVKP